jgi:hypothetical protein
MLGINAVLISGAAWSAMATDMDSDDDEPLLNMLKKPSDPNLEPLSELGEVDLVDPVCVCMTALRPAHRPCYTADVSHLPRYRG